MSMKKYLIVTIMFLVTAYSGFSQKPLASDLFRIDTIHYARLSETQAQRALEMRDSFLILKAQYKALFVQLTETQRALEKSQSLIDHYSVMDKKNQDLLDLQRQIVLSRDNALLLSQTYSKGLEGELKQKNKTLF